MADDSDIPNNRSIRIIVSKHDTPCMDQLFRMISELTQEFGQKKALAASIGTDPQSLNKWFAGRYKPNGETTLQLLRWVISQKLERNSDLEDILVLLMQTSDQKESNSGKPNKNQSIPRSDDVFGLLSVRARNCLKREGFQTKDQVIAALQSESLHPSRQRQYGARTHAEVCQWAGLAR